MSRFTFRNRPHAGQALARELTRYRDRDDVVVLALPRGGVPIGLEIARALHVPLKVFIVRKLGVPGHEELAMGAIATGGTRVLNENVISQMRIGDEQIEAVTARENAELERRERIFRGGNQSIPFEDRICILVDDGLATGSTMRAAVRALEQHYPKRVVVAVPVAAADTCAEFDLLVDEVVCLYTPEPFLAVGRWYDDFAQLTDEDVRSLLGSAIPETAH